MLLDSNAVIYFSKDHSFEKFIQSNDSDLYASEITRLEVIGYHKILEEDKIILEDIFNLLILIDVDKPIIDQAIKLRQKKNISIGDSIIAATCLLYKLPLVTANVSDFKWIEEILLVNPFEIKG